VYADKLASPEKYTGDAFVDGTSAMAVVGPWAVATYKGKVDWGVVPVPTSAGKPAGEIHTFSDAKNVGMYSACKNRGTAWDVLKFATSKDQDGKFLAATGQMPLRKDVAATFGDFFAKNPDYKVFADQASRTVEVPNVANSITIWQTFRDAYSKSVIFGQQDPGAALDEAAQKINQLASQS
jgi:multiple sugar transport system substrate-binding protein